MTRPRYTDHRPLLEISQDTWEREDEEGRRRLIVEASLMGRRLSIIGRTGEAWSPPAEPAGW